MIRAWLPALAGALALAVAAPAADDRVEAVIRDVDVLDVVSGTVRFRFDVVVRGTRIDDVRPSGAAVPPAKYVIDGSGKFLIPGLVDDEARLGSVGRDEAGRFLVWGVTSVRAVDIDRGAWEAWRRDLDRGRFYGPRVIAAGSGLTTGEAAGPADPTSIHERVRRLTGSGLSPAAALRAVTLQPVERAGRAADLGSISPGKIADVVVLSASPLADIRNTRRIDAVVFRGEVLTRAHLNLLEAGSLKPGTGVPAPRD